MTLKIFPMPWYKYSHEAETLHKRVYENLKISRNILITELIIKNQYISPDTTFGEN